MVGDGINLGNLYTLFWVFVVIVICLLMGAVLENSDKIRYLRKHGLKAFLQKNARSRVKKRRGKDVQAHTHAAVTMRTFLL